MLARPSLDARTYALAAASLAASTASLAASTAGLAAHSGPCGLHGCYSFAGASASAVNVLTVSRLVGVRSDPRDRSFSYARFCISTICQRAAFRPPGGQSGDHIVAGRASGRGQCRVRLEVRGTGEGDAVAVRAVRIPDRGG